VAGHGGRRIDPPALTVRTMTRHVIRAGPIGTSAEAIWHSRTGELTGDQAIVDRAMRMDRVITRLGRSPRPIDWHDGTTAVPAVLDAAGSVYGGPVDHFAYPDEGEPIFADSDLGDADRTVATESCATASLIGYDRSSSIRLPGQTWVPDEAPERP